MRETLGKSRRKIFLTVLPFKGKRSLNWSLFPTPLKTVFKKNAILLFWQFLGIQFLQEVFIRHHLSVEGGGRGSWKDRWKVNRQCKLESQSAKRLIGWKGQSIRKKSWAWIWIVLEDNFNYNLLVSFLPNNHFCPVSWKQYYVVRAHLNPEQE